ncbi:TlpA family protein disulfide reductase [Pseudomonas lalucatii]|uniref:TlpA family protein disulfide reductase n=1 Tax=Pseudomonas lalucatii TaxID=1424203 RepID=A0ABS5Q3K2_9PSED|nr:TlpA disulfide reductase family protein [Pseudomonas lalucatii]MBS7663327.1 TlpA family protein disulfide reductase [Pseudomonas lalucatii]MBS7689893.1 TlpA family protein disulfide reductase [Pseudomonas lalucatii]
MGMRLQAVMRTVVGLCACLILASCAEDIGVDQHGRKVAAEQLEGQWLVINYWAEWCAPCRSEIPELNALARQLHDRSVRVVGVNFDGLQGAELSSAAQALSIEFTVLQQDPAARYQLPRSEVLPVTYLVDDRGRLRERLLGEQTAAGLAAHLDRLRGGE